MPRLTPDWMQATVASVMQQSSPELFFTNINGLIITNHTNFINSFHFWYPFVPEPFFFWGGGVGGGGGKIDKIK